LESAAKRAYLLGAYPGNTHISINNYFDYCRESIQTYLKDWQFSALRPGQFGDGHFLKADVDRGQAWKELYFDWPLKLRKLHGDVFHIVDQGLAWYRLFLPAGKTIITVHDLINVLNVRGRMSLETLPLRRQQMLKISMSQIQKSDAVICPSRATAADVERELRISAQRIHVIYNSIPAVFQPMAESERLAARRRLFGDARHAILHVGKATAYKNRMGALRIFELIHRALPDSKLLLTSQVLTQEEEGFLRGRACAAAVGVRQPEQQEGLRELYCAADVFLFPSITEGFGWPPVEAMACGCPVVSSIGGSLSEIVGEGAVRMPDAMDAQAFADAAIEILKDERAAGQWREQGLVNAKRFSEATLGPQLADLYFSVSQV
jgi:glycosyltransferase involved in cell wall biosynthesis